MPNRLQLNYADPDPYEPENYPALAARFPADLQRTFRGHLVTRTPEEMEAIVDAGKRIYGTQQPAPYDEFTETALCNAVSYLRAYAAKIDAQRSRAEMEEQITAMLATGSSRELRDRAAQWIWTLQRLRCGRKIQAAWESAVWYRIAILEQTEGLQ